MSMHEYCGLSELRSGLASRNLLEIWHSEICEFSQLLTVVVVVVVVQSWRQQLWSRGGGMVYRSSRDTLQSVEERTQEPKIAVKEKNPWCWQKR